MIMAILSVTLAFAAPDYPYTGNYTRIRKPGFPVEIEEDQIQPGEVWTYKIPLKKDRKYHIYLIGEWVDFKNHITDYDIFFYKDTGSKETFLSSHTEAAGYPEQVSNDGRGQYFIPPESDDYLICVRNDPNDSNSSQVATLMIIEHIEANIYHYVEMKEPVMNKTIPKSTWAYEFNTSKPRIKINIEVPSTLDITRPDFTPWPIPNKPSGTP